MPSSTKEKLGFTRETKRPTVTALTVSSVNTRMALSTAKPADTAPPVTIARTPAWLSAIASGLVAFAPAPTCSTSAAATPSG